MSTSKQPFTFDALTHFALCQTIFGAYQAGMWEPFRQDLDHVLEPEAFTAAHGGDARLIRGLAEYFSRRGLMEPVASGERTGFRLSPQGRALVDEDWLGYFVFMVGGYGEVLHASGGLASGKIRYGQDLVRNGHYVALGSEILGRSRNHRSFEVILARASEGPRPRTVLDLGCGSAAFLMMLMERTGAEHGIGVDINEESCVLSRENLAAAGFSDRARVFHRDARKLLEEQPELEASVDLVTAVFLVHEFFSLGPDVAAQKLRDVCRTLVPDRGRLLILDKHTDILQDNGAPPYFSEFKLVHDLTDQVLYTRSQWQELFERAGLEIVHERALAPHTGSILFECRRRDAAQ